MITLLVSITGLPLNIKIYPLAMDFIEQGSE